MKHIALIIAVLLTRCAGAQDDGVLNHVPHQYSVELSGSHAFHNDMDSVGATGAGLLFDYAWQLSGFAGGKKAFITVPLGYTYLFPGPGNRHGGGLLTYGWTVRHELAVDRKVIPYIGYALMINQLMVHDMDGGVIGHKTVLSAGILAGRAEHTKPFLTLSYSYNTFRTLGIKKGEVMQMLHLATGFRF